MDDPLSGFSPHSFWLTLGLLMEALTRNGYGHIEIMHNDLSHLHGRAVTLGATIGA